MLMVEESKTLAKEYQKNHQIIIQNPGLIEQQP